MSRILQALASVDRPAIVEDDSDSDSACDRVIIQTFEADHETLELRLTATVVTSMARLRAAA